MTYVLSRLLHPVPGPFPSELDLRGRSFRVLGQVDVTGLGYRGGWSRELAEIFATGVHYLLVLKGENGATYGAAWNVRTGEIGAPVLLEED